MKKNITVEDIKEISEIKDNVTKLRVLHDNIITNLFDTCQAKPIQTTLFTALIKEIIKIPDDGLIKFRAIESTIGVCYMNLYHHLGNAWCSSEPIKTKILSDLTKEIVNTSDDEQGQLLTNIIFYHKRYEILSSFLIEAIGTINDSSQKVKAINAIAGHLSLPFEHLVYLLKGMKSIHSAEMYVFEKQVEKSIPLKLFPLLVDKTKEINDSSQKAKAIICLHKTFPSFTNELRILAETISNESIKNSVLDAIEPKPAELSFTNMIDSQNQNDKGRNMQSLN